MWAAAFYPHLTSNMFPCLTPSHSAPLFSSPPILVSILPSIMPFPLLFFPFICHKKGTAPITPSRASQPEALGRQSRRQPTFTPHLNKILVLLFPLLIDRPFLHTSRLPKKKKRKGSPLFLVVVSGAHLPISFPCSRATNDGRFMLDQSNIPNTPALFLRQRRGSLIPKSLLRWAEEINLIN